jgi:uncharacterized protein YwqG
MDGFPEQASILQKYLLPCIGFSLDGTGSTPVGSSRLGGGPDLPPSFDWPVDKGRPLDFLLQVNLRDVAAHDSTGLFPRAGLLTFFYVRVSHFLADQFRNVTLFTIYYLTIDYR